MNGVKVFQIKVNNRNDAADFDKGPRDVLRRSGRKGEEIAFLLDGGNAPDSSFLERMKALLVKEKFPNASRAF